MKMNIQNVLQQFSRDVLSSRTRPRHSGSALRPTPLREISDHLADVVLGVSKLPCNLQAGFGLNTLSLFPSVVLVDGAGVGRWSLVAWQVRMPPTKIQLQRVNIADPAAHSFQPLEELGHDIWHHGSRVGAFEVCEMRLSTQRYSSTLSGVLVDTAQWCQIVMASFLCAFACNPGKTLGGE